MVAYWITCYWSDRIHAMESIILTKEDIAFIFEAIILNFEGVKMIDTMKHGIKTKHIVIANDVYELIKRKW